MPDSMNDDHSDYGSMSREHYDYGKINIEFWYLDGDISLIDLQFPSIVLVWIDKSSWDLWYEFVVNDIVFVAMLI